MKHKMNFKMEGSLLCNQKQSDLNISQLGDKFVIFHLQSWREFAQKAWQTLNFTEHFRQLMNLILVTRGDRMAWTRMRGDSCQSFIRNGTD